MIVAIEGIVSAGKRSKGKTRLQMIHGIQERHVDMKILYKDREKWRVAIKVEFGQNT